MTDAELLTELHGLGIDAESHRVVCLLPLIQVAWADGTVQRAERTRIVAIAEGHGMLGGDGARILAGWLSAAPTESYLERGRRALRELVHHEHPLGRDITAETLDTLVSYCEEVARASGGLFGMVWSVDERERRALVEIARELRLSARR